MIAEICRHDAILNLYVNSNSYVDLKALSLITRSYNNSVRCGLPIFEIVEGRATKNWVLHAILSSMSFISISYLFSGYSRQYMFCTVPCTIQFICAVAFWSLLCRLNVLKTTFKIGYTWLYFVFPNTCSISQVCLLLCEAVTKIYAVVQYTSHGHRFYEQYKPLGMLPGWHY